jgi:hypothetical protein
MCKRATYSLHMPFKQKISPEKVQEWIKRHAAGDTMSKIAADDNVHVSTVSRRLRAAAPTQWAAPISIPAGARVHLHAPDDNWVASTNEGDLEHALDIHHQRGPLTISPDPPKPQPPA